MGMRISVAHPLHTGTQVHFSFGAGCDQQVQGVGHIAWIDGSKKSAGICFVHLSEESSNTIDTLLKSASLTLISAPSPKIHTSDPSSQCHNTPGSPLAAGATEPRTFAFEAPRQTASPDFVQATEGRSLDDADGHMDIREQLALSDCPTTTAVSPATTTEHDAVPFCHSYEAADQSLRKNIFNGSDDGIAPYGIGPSIQSSSLDSPIIYAPDARPQNPLPGNTAEPSVELRVATTQSDQLPQGLNDPLPIFTLAPTYQCPPSRLALVSKAILPALNEIGWGLESDWHVIIGIVLLVAGFIALWPHPPLIMLAVALWIAGASLLSGRKTTTKQY